MDTKERADASSGRFRSLFERSPAGLCRVTLNGEILECNEAYARIFGYASPEEIARHRTESLYANPHDRRVLIDQLQRHGALTNLELCLRKKDGSPVWVLVTAALTEDEQGQPSIIEGTLFDISERRRVEEALRASDQRFDLMTRATSDCVWDWTLGSNTTWLSPTIADLFGYAPEEVLQVFDWWADRIHPEDRSRILSSLESVIQSREQSWSGEYRFRRGDGSYAIVFDRGYVLRDKDAKPVRMVGAMTDITNRKTAEEALRQSEGRFRDLFENASDGIFTTNAAGRLTSANKAMIQITGHEPEKLVGMALHDILATEHRELADQMLKEHGEAGNPARYELEIVGSDGRRVPLEVHARPLFRDRERVGIQGIAREISERRRTESLLLAEKRVLETIASGLSLSEVLKLLCETVERQSPGMLCSVLLLDRGGAKLRHGAAPSLSSRFCKAVDRSTIGLASGPGDTVAFRGKPMIVADIATDRLWVQWRQLALEYGLKACWSMPVLSTDGRVLGALTMYYLEPRSPTPQEMLLVERASHLARIAIEQKRSDDALRTLSGRLLHVQDEERRRIAVELHETVAQSLTALTINLGSLKQLRSKLGRKGRTLVSESLLLGEQCLRDLRTFSQLLYPPQLERAGLAATLRSYVRGFSKRSGIDVRFTVPRRLTRLPQDMEGTLFRVVQECLSNVHRHSGSKVAFVRLNQINGKVALAVEDRGRGMPGPVLASAEGLEQIGVGLAGMRARIRQLGGEFEVISGPKGVKVSVALQISNGVPR